MLQHHNLVKEVSVAGLKLDVDELDIKKPKAVLDDLNLVESKVNKIYIIKFKPFLLIWRHLAILQIMMLQKKVYDQLVTKVNGNGSVKKTRSAKKITETVNKIPRTTVVIRKTDYDTKITKTRSEILDVTDLIKKIDFDPNLDNSSRVTLKYRKYSIKKIITWLLLQD